MKATCVEVSGPRNDFDDLVNTTATLQSDGKNTLLFDGVVIPVKTQVQEGNTITVRSRFGNTFTFTVAA